VVLSVSTLLMSIHDTAVDGLAVQFLSPSEISLGAFGQYAGYKLGTLLTGGVLPTLLGSNHRALCVAMVIVMSSISLVTMQYDISSFGESKPTRGSERLPGNTPVSNSKRHKAVDTRLPAIRRQSDDSEKCLHSETKEQKISALRALRGSLSAAVRPYFASKSSALLIVVLFFYKAAEHGMDFIWTPMLVQNNVKRSDILQTQFLLGSVASIAGAWLGGQLCEHMSAAEARRRRSFHSRKGYMPAQNRDGSQLHRQHGSHDADRLDGSRGSNRSDYSSALALVASLRLVPECMQLAFSMYDGPHTRSAAYITAHAVVENIIGSALTTTMLSYLLSQADPASPATSYAFMNSIALVGMRVGEYFGSLLSSKVGFTCVCAIGVVMNGLYPFCVLYRERIARIL
jgi:hypothetical protein